MLPKRLQSQMIREWFYGLNTSGICYPRGYKVKWWHSEFMVCIPQVYATQEATKWNDDSKFMICIPQVYATQEVTKWNDDSEFMGCIPQVYATQEVTKWSDDKVRVCIP